MKAAILATPLKLNLKFTALNITGFDLPIPGSGETDIAVGLSATRSTNSSEGVSGSFNATLFFRVEVTLAELNAALGQPWRQAPL